MNSVSLFVSPSLFKLIIVVDLSSYATSTNNDTRTHHMQLCPSTLTKCHAHLVIFETTKPNFITTKPQTYPKATKYQVWNNATSEEINVLFANSTWTLVPRSYNANITGCKWIYRIKRKSDGSIE